MILIIFCIFVSVLTIIFDIVIRGEKFNKVGKYHYFVNVFPETPLFTGFLA